jgi:hypothetical protein
VQDVDITDGHAFLHKVEVDLDMLHALVLNGLGGEVDGADVVVVDEGALRQQSMELLKELPQPAGLHHAIGHGLALSLSTRVGDGVLMLRRLGDEVDAEKHSVAQCGPTCVRQGRRRGETLVNPSRHPG